MFFVQQIIEAQEKQPVEPRLLVLQQASQPLKAGPSLAEVLVLLDAGLALLPHN
jgi:hypothetical protein